MDRWVISISLAVFVLISICPNSKATSFQSDGENGDPISEQESDRVFDLPGQSFNASFAHYAGYVTVDEKAGRALFYWFFESVDDPSSKPIVLWLNGGPGCSSIAYGEAEELGPFHIKSDGKTVYLNPHAWNQVANVIFLDSPVGVGFSYANNSKELLNNGDKRTAKDSLSFLKNWLKRFPQYKGRDFYLTGESYAGHYVPQLAQAIVRYNNLTGDKSINLKGYMVGNALTDDFYDHLGVFKFLWSTGLISDQTYRLLNIFCDFQSFVHISDQCNNILALADQEVGNIDGYSIYTPTCPNSNGMFLNRLLKKHLFGRVGEPYDPCTEIHSTVYFNLPEVQAALHVNPAFYSSKSNWSTCRLTCSDLVDENWKDSQSSILPIYHELIGNGL